MTRTNGSPNLTQTTRSYNNLTQTTRSYNNQHQKKKTCKIVDIAVLADYRVKLKECEKRDKYLDLARELKKTLEYESDDYPICNWCYKYSHQRISTRTGGLGNNRLRGDHPNYCIIVISQNTEKSSEDLRRLVVTPVRHHQIMLVWKTLKKVYTIIIMPARILDLMIINRSQKKKKKENLL